MKNIVILGASGAGKSVIEKGLVSFGYKKIISYTTRKPRLGEVDGQDYHFVSNSTFESMIQAGMLAEYEEYSQGRLYGTLKNDYRTQENLVVVLTPNGFRQLQDKENIFTVLITANLGTRVKRYIDRCGDKFNFDDMNEITARVNRDFGMFLGVEHEVDLVVENNDNVLVYDVIRKILSNVGGVIKSI